VTGFEVEWLTGLEMGKLTRFEIEWLTELYAEWQGERLKDIDCWKSDN
jgi:hypothetical protein